MFLIVGGDSEIGGAAFSALKSQDHAVVATTRRQDRVGRDLLFLDLAASLDGWEPPQGATSACVCAAVARLADCVADPQASAHINVSQTLTLADKLLRRGIYVLFLLTNQVFDGRVAQVPRGAPHMALLQRWIADLARGEPISAFTDMTLAPTPMASVTGAISSLLSERASGIFQLTGPRDVSYADVGHFLAGKLGVDSSLVQTASARAAGLPEGATPLHTTLDSSALRNRFGIEVADVWQVIESVTGPDRGNSRTIPNPGGADNVRTR